MVLTDIAKGAATNIAVKTATKIAGKNIAGPISWGIFLASAGRTMYILTKNDPHSKIIEPFQEEKDKWIGASGLIGSERYDGTNTYNVYDNSAIALLSNRNILGSTNKGAHLGYSDAPIMEELKRQLTPDPAKSKERIESSLMYVDKTKNPIKIKDVFFEVEDFDCRKNLIITDLENARDQIPDKHDAEFNYEPIKHNLSDIVQNMNGFKDIYDDGKRPYEVEYRKRLARNGITALVSAAIGSKLTKG